MTYAACFFLGFLGGFVGGFRVAVLIKLGAQQVDQAPACTCRQGADVDRNELPPICPLSGLPTDWMLSVIENPDVATRCTNVDSADQVPEEQP